MLYTSNRTIDSLSKGIRIVVYSHTRVKYVTTQVAAHYREFANYPSKQKQNVRPFSEDHLIKFKDQVSPGELS